MNENTIAYRAGVAIMTENHEPEAPIVSEGNNDLSGKFYGAIYGDGSMFLFIREMEGDGEGAEIFSESLDEALRGLKECDKESFSGVATQLWARFAERNKKV